MRKIRGLRLRDKIVKVFKWSIHRTTKPKGSSCTIKAMSKLCKWGRSLKRRAKGLCLPMPSYLRVGHDPIEARQTGTPKGHLAVYVGEKEDDTQRYLVPVIYFNHPLFAKLLWEVENKYGFNHQGGIQIPCRISEFENVRTQIAAAADGGDCRWRQRT